jgi:hypothetical protein
MIMRHETIQLRLDSLNIEDISTKFNIYRIVAVEWLYFFVIITNFDSFKQWVLRSLEKHCNLFMICNF